MPLLTRDPPGPLAAAITSDTQAGRGILDSLANKSMTRASIRRGKSSSRPPGNMIWPATERRQSNHAMMSKMLRVRIYLLLNLAQLSQLCTQSSIFKTKTLFQNCLHRDLENIPTIRYFESDWPLTGITKRLRGGTDTVSDSDDNSDSDRYVWLRDMGPFEFPTRQRVDLAAVRVSAIRDIFYIPNWVSASEEAEIIRRSDAAPPSAWVTEAGRRFQV